VRTVADFGVGRRASFEHYVHAFAHAGEDDASDLRILNNLLFLQEDLANVEIPARSFVVCVHACNEANKLSVSKAVAAGIIPEA
jgi:hypothetical protein